MRQLRNWEKVIQGFSRRYSLHKQYASGIQGVANSSIQLRVFLFLLKEVPSKLKIQNMKFQKVSTHQFSPRSMLYALLRRKQTRISLEQCSSDFKGVEPLLLKYICWVWGRAAWSDLPRSNRFERKRVKIHIEMYKKLMSYTGLFV